MKEETATGTSSSTRVRTTLTLAVEGTEFDTAACMLRVKGRNVVENRFVKVGRWSNSSPHQDSLDTMDSVISKQPFLFLCVSPLSCAQMGAYHTIDLVLNQPFTLIKDNWDFITLDRLGELSPSSPYTCTHHTHTHTTHTHTHTHTHHRHTTHTHTHTHTHIHRVCTGGTPSSLLCRFSM